MKIIEEILDLSFDIGKIFDNYVNENIIFFDIETTGLSPDRGEVYLIGCLVFQQNQWRLIQFLSESPSDEKKILVAFQNLCNFHDTYIHFNGRSFDIPYLNKKFSHYHLKGFSSLSTEIDLFRKIKSYHALLQLETYSLSSLMEFVGRKRKDFFTGRELIGQYLQYRSQKSSCLEKNILLHNKEDVLGLLDVFIIEQQIQALKSAYKVNSWYIESNSIEEKKLHGSIQFNHPSYLDFVLNLPWGKIIFYSKDTKADLCIQLFHGTAYHFFDNYKEYYYIADQDEAIHKSVGKFLPPIKRKQATASNCYIKKEGLFIPIWMAVDNLPLFFLSIRKEQGYLPINFSNQKELLSIWLEQWLQTIFLL